MLCYGSLLFCSFLKSRFDGHNDLGEEDHDYENSMKRSCFGENGSFWMLCHTIVLWVLRKAGLYYDVSVLFGPWVNSHQKTIRFWEVLGFSKERAGQEADNAPRGTKGYQYTFGRGGLPTNVYITLMTE